MKTKLFKVGVFALACTLFFALFSCDKEEVANPETNSIDNLTKTADLKHLKANISSWRSLDFNDDNDRLLFEKLNKKKNSLKIAYDEAALNGVPLKEEEDPGQKISIPDVNFEQALIDLGVDDVLDGLVYKNNVKQITFLDVQQRGITDLTGIEEFKKLEYLNCSENQLTSLDLSNNVKLKELYCIFNQLTSLDVTKNTRLTNLWCSINPLTSLDVSKNSLLEELFTSTTNLTNLDVSNNLELIRLSSRNMSLTSLDVSNNTKLEVLLVGPFNGLESLDLSENTALQVLNCTGNLLTSLDVRNGNNINVTSFNAMGNPDLNCIDVDSAIYSEINWPGKDPGASFSKDCSAAPVFCISELAGTHSFVSSNLNAETGSCPVGSISGTVTWTYLGNGIYSTSDLSFGHYESTCWFDTPATSPDAKFGDDCNYIISGGRDQYGLTYTWTITGVSGSELYISWENNWGDFSSLNDSGDVVLTREGGANWPDLFTQ